jgi:hypothetical protein
MAAEFPLPSASSSNPIPQYFQMEPEEFVVGKTTYDDGGTDYKLQHGGVGVKRWVIRYGLLSIAAAAILDAWAATMFYSPDEGSAVGANFRHHIPGTAWTDTSGTLYSGVHIAPGGYRKSHTKTWNNAREFILEKRP